MALIEPEPLVGERELTGGWRVAHALAWGWDERDGWSEWSVENARLVLGA